MNRYTIEEGSNSAHCCFSYTIVDTAQPEIWNGEILTNHETGQPRFTTVCECFEKEDADKVCDALNNSAVVVNEEMLEALKAADAVFEYVHKNPEKAQKIVKAAIAEAEAAKKRGLPCR